MRRLFLMLLCCLATWKSVAQQPDSTLLQRDTTPVQAPDSIAPATNKKKFKLQPAEAAPVATSDSLAPRKERRGIYYRFFVKKYPNPRAAALLSFLLPGAGQAYNKKWWKIPIAYAALGGMAWLATDNDQEYQRLKKNYKWLVDGDATTQPVDAPYIYMSASQMKGYRDQFRGYTEKSYLFLGITYLLVVTDAFVDAHLKHFDVSDDLSLRIAPDIQSGGTGFGAAFGVGLRVRF